MRRVAKRLRGYFDNNESGRDSRHRVYISRAKAAFRRVVNEDEISPSLREHGIETVLAEDLSLKQQVRLFARARAIIGGHGAGLTNLIYCKPNSFVGEIYIDGLPPAYSVLSQQLDMRFNRFKADTLEIARQVDMQVNAAAFRKWIFDCFDVYQDVGGSPKTELDAE
jgi:hypothetical protein